MRIGFFREPNQKFDTAAISWIRPAKLNSIYITWTTKVVVSLLIPCLRLDPQIRFYEYNIQNIPVLAENIYLKRIGVIFSLGRMKVKLACFGLRYKVHKKGRCVNCTYSTDNLKE